MTTRGKAPEKISVFRPLAKNGARWQVLNPGGYHSIPQKTNPIKLMRSNRKPHVGDRFTVNHNSDGYEAGKTYVVSCVDHSDNTLRGTEENSSHEKPWIQWSKIVPGEASIGWDWLKTQLPDDAIEILSAFNGLDCLYLRPQIRDRIVRTTPNLLQRILLSKNDLENGDSPNAQRGGLNNEDDDLGI